MNNINILWIDDDWGASGTSKLQKLERIRKQILSKVDNVTINTTDTIPDGIVEMFHSNNKLYHLVISDLKYLNTKKKYHFNLVVENTLKRHIPTIIFSNRLEEYDLDLTAFSNGNSPHLLGIFDKANEGKLIDFIVNFVRFKPIKIAHISDLHFDSTLQGQRKAEQATRFKTLIDTLKKEHEIAPIDLLIFTGDFATRNQQRDFEGCFLILKSIVQATVKDYSKLLVIPGNHDIEWEDYSNSKISRTPCKAFYDFLEKIYIGNSNLEILDKYSGFNPSYDSFEKHYEPSSFCWREIFMDLNVEIIGLSSVTIDEDKKGYGYVDETVMEFLKKQWTPAPLPNHIRIALLHHNILPPFSLNPLEENGHILNTGEVIKLLSELNCDMILSGHCHDSYLYNFSFSTLYRRGYSSMKNIVYLSTGTAGGYTAVCDRARSFNIINIFSSSKTDKINLVIKPYFYDSGALLWEDAGILNSVISK